MQINNYNKKIKKDDIELVEINQLKISKNKNENLDEYKDAFKFEKNEDELEL